LFLVMPAEQTLESRDVTVGSSPSVANRAQPK
jgi:hypothetical protein